MAINMTSLNNAISYLTLANNLSRLASVNSYNNYMGNYGYYNSYDSSPYLNCAYGSNSYTFSVIMSMLMQKIMQLLGQLLCGQSTSGNNTNTQQNNCEEVSTTPTTEAAKAAEATQTKKEAKDVVKLTDKNIKSKLRNEEGVSYVIITGKGCGRCSTFEPVLKAVNKNLGTQATFFNLDGGDSNNSVWTLVKEAGSKKTSFGYPMIVKCVNGKATDVYDYSDIKNIYSNKTKMTDWFSKNIQS